MGITSFQCWINPLRPAAASGAGGAFMVCNCGKGEGLVTVAPVGWGTDRAAGTGAHRQRSRRARHALGRDRERRRV
jgi:hypothetical protein